MEKFRNWYLTNFPAINWFIIGSLTTFGLVDLSYGNYGSGIVCLAIAYLNFLFRDRV
jgi:hypothetical protein